MFKVLGMASCHYCEKSIRALTRANLPFTYVDLGEYPEIRRRLVSNGFKTVPQIYLEQKHLGGYDQLIEFLGHE